MGADPAHRVETDRAASHGFVGDAAKVGPFAVQGYGIVERGAGDFGGQLPDAFGGDARGLRHRFRRIVFGQIAVRHVVQDRAVGDACVAVSGGEVGFDPCAIPCGEFSGAAVDDLRFAVFIAQEQAVLRRIGVFVDDHRGIGEPGEVGQVDPPRLHQQVDEGEDQQPVGARRDAIPVVGDSVIPGADRVDRHDLGPARFQLAEADLDRV